MKKTTFKNLLEKIRQTKKTHRFSPWDNVISDAFNEFDKLHPAERLSYDEKISLRHSIICNLHIQKEVEKERVRIEKNRDNNPFSSSAFLEGARNAELEEATREAIYRGEISEKDITNPRFRYGGKHPTKDFGFTIK
jgi:hypothetical protein